MTDVTDTDLTEIVADARNRAERRRAERAERRSGSGPGKRGRFKYTEKKAMIDAIKGNLAQWEQTREFHELNIDKNEAQIDALDSTADDYEERLRMLEDAIADEERSIKDYDLAIANGEARVAELQAR